MDNELEFLIYNTPDNAVSVNSVIEDNTIWLTQKAMAELFECSIDYDKNADITNEFYAMIQNKFHYAITGKTAAEIIHSSADCTKEHMGLKTFRNSPDGRVLKNTAEQKSYSEYERFNKTQKINSDFEKSLKRLAKWECGGTYE